MISCTQIFSDTYESKQPAKKTCSMDNPSYQKIVSGGMAIMAVTLIIAGWIATIQMRKCNSFTESEKNWSLAMSILGIPFPLLQFVPIFITQSQQLCAAPQVNPVSTFRKRPVQDSISPLRMPVKV